MFVVLKYLKTKKFIKDFENNFFLVLFAKFKINNYYYTETEEGELL